ncbi:uroporphyrinogen-III C-methyltransferase [Sneathiella chinensis]|uniref:uroporphyrinogen-III C-methyltransferase n=1 Tax=Sneathiella chinensis TaxID=349750 RepID=A0ABQ5U2M7_9PROT|nr:uroporphyrinogen-III C-methyltransferase [Sneathiella chinensis]GLQ06164.1 uroporphyrin-III C-methyltransferase [Sneathiella chinensis]
MDKILGKIPDFKPGSVWLLGAGPGDPGLLTLYAVAALQQADILVYDALVSKDILELTGPGCILEYAGKRGGKPSAKQKDISERLVALAKEGKRVLRLKGGDPYIFGRGGEEALTLKANNIPFRVIPGVSSGVGGLAFAGIPLTHRDTNSAATFVTGHDASGEVPSVNWEHIAKGSPVIVIYMGMKHIAIITEKLMGYGRSADEPVAIIADATTERQKVLTTTLSRATDDVAKSGIEPPALIVVGHVVDLHHKLDWFTQEANKQNNPSGDRD